MHQLKADLNQSRREIETLKSKIQRFLEEHGINVDEQLETDLERIMDEGTNKVPWYMSCTLQGHFFVYFGIINFRQSRLDREVVPELETNVF